MANKNPVKKFQKGNQAAKGREVRPEVYENRKVSRLMLEAAIHKYFYHTHAELAAILKEPGLTPAYELMVVSILAKGIGGGDTNRMEALFNRIHGKVPDRIEFEDKTVDQDTKKQIVDQLLEVAKEFK